MHPRFYFKMKTFSFVDCFFVSTMRAAGMRPVFVSALRRFFVRQEEKQIYQPEDEFGVLLNIGALPDSPFKGRFTFHHDRSLF